ncbi:hypothetical protein [Sphingobium sp. sgz301303]
MSAQDPVITALFIASYNADLAALDSSARVAVPSNAPNPDMLELQDDEGTCLAMIPASAAPQMVAIAYRLYGRGLNLGVRAGEEAAWAKLRHMIGAAAA